MARPRRRVAPVHDPEGPGRACPPTAPCRALVGPLALLSGASGRLSALAPRLAATSAPGPGSSGAASSRRASSPGSCWAWEGSWSPSSRGVRASRTCAMSAAPPHGRAARARRARVLRVIPGRGARRRAPRDDAALVATGVLVLAAGIHRAPTLPGVHRQLVWIAAWLVPLGFWLAALAPRLRTAALHVVFVGGFTCRRSRSPRTSSCPAAAVRSRSRRAPGGACRRGAHRARLRRAPARRDRSFAHPVLAGGRWRRVRGRDPRLGGAGPTCSPGRRPVVLEEQAGLVPAGAEPVEDGRDDPRGAVDDVERRGERVLLDLARGEVRDPRR